MKASEIVVVESDDAVAAIAIAIAIWWFFILISYEDASRGDERVVRLRDGLVWLI